MQKHVTTSVAALPKALQPVPSPYKQLHNLFLLEEKDGVYAAAGENLASQKPKKYTLTIHDLPSEERPREKLIEQGPAALSIDELLAVILVTGTRKETLLDMTQRILKEYGERSILSATDVKILSGDLSIPEVKAAQIVACGELGRRFHRKSRDGVPVLRTAEDVFTYTIDMRNLTKEQLRGLYLNAHYQLVHDEVISIGTVDANIVHPREVFRPALAYAAAAVILVHNHPSGNLNPSAADLLVTKQLKEAGRLLGIDLIDHVIVTLESYASIHIA
jgi:DNA repair protein RadC